MRNANKTKLGFAVDDEKTEMMATPPAMLALRAQRQPAASAKAAPASESAPAVASKAAAFTSDDEEHTPVFSAKVAPPTSSKAKVSFPTGIVPLPPPPAFAPKPVSVKVEPRAPVLPAYSAPPPAPVTTLDAPVPGVRARGSETRIRPASFADVAVRGRSDSQLEPPPTSVSAVEQTVKLRAVDPTSRKIATWMPMLAVGVLLGLAVPMGARDATRADPHAAAAAPARVEATEPAAAPARVEATEPAAAKPAPAPVEEAKLTPSAERKKVVAADDDAPFAGKPTPVKHGKHTKARAEEPAGEPAPALSASAKKVAQAHDEPRAERPASVETVGDADLMARQLLEQSLR